MNKMKKYVLTFLASVMAVSLTVVPAYALDDEEINIDSEIVDVIEEEQTNVDSESTEVIIEEIEEEIVSEVVEETKGSEIAQVLSQGVEISDVNFPDVALRQDLLKRYYDADQDGYLSQSEIERITSYSIPKTTANLKGLELLTHLESLTISGNTGLETVNISNWDSLKTIYVRSSDLKLVSLKQMNKLETVRIYINVNLTTLELQDLPLLRSVTSPDVTFKDASIINAPQLQLGSFDKVLFSNNVVLDNVVIKNLTLDADKVAKSKYTISNSNIETIRLVETDFSGMTLNNNTYGTITLESTPNLDAIDFTQFAGLTKLNIYTILSKDLVIENKSLEGISISDQDSLSVAKNISIINNDNLTSLSVRDKSVRKFKVSGNKLLETLSLWGQESIEHLEITNNAILDHISGAYSDSLTYIDLRGNYNLRVYHHANEGETVYISAGMLKYIGCDAILSHTGNLKIDLNGAYSDNSDGTRTIDLKKILSPEYIDLFEQYNPGLLQGDSLLVVQSGQASYSFQVGKADNGDATTWTLYTQLNNVDDVVITYNLDGGEGVTGSVLAIGAVPSLPLNPTKEGYVFAGWFADAAFTTPFDHSLPLTEDTTVYAKWDKVDEETTVKPEEVKPEVPTESKTEDTKTPEKTTVATGVNTSLTFTLMILAAGVGLFVVTLKTRKEI